MAHTDDPVADRGAQLEAAYAVYATGLDRIAAERKTRDDASAAQQKTEEAALFTEWQTRVVEITGGPGPSAPPAERFTQIVDGPQPPYGPGTTSTTGADQEAADIAESGQ